MAGMLNNHFDNKKARKKATIAVILLALFITLMCVFPKVIIPVLVGIIGIFSVAIFVFLTWNLFYELFD